MTDRDEEILKMPLDEEELDEVSGGRCILAGADGNGGCTQYYYTKKCDATVEQRSRCHRHDYCPFLKHIKYKDTVDKRKHERTSSS